MTKRKETTSLNQGMNDELSALLHRLLLSKEEYRIMSFGDNPDHWSRGYRAGYLEGFDRVVEMINEQQIGKKS